MGGGGGGGGAGAPKHLVLFENDYVRTILRMCIFIWNAIIELEAQFLQYFIPSSSSVPMMP